MSKKCQNCQLEFGIFKYQYHCSDCKGAFCSACLDFALVTEEESKKGNSATASSFCEKCFIKNSNLDYSKNYEFYGTEIGGGGSRTMFRPHAKEISSKLGYNCILIDLPGHGSRMNEKLSLKTCFDVIEDSVKNLAPPFENKKAIIVGGSLGGYITMEILGKYPDLFDGAIVTMCGQNVGVNRSTMASIGLTALNLLSGYMGSKMLLNAMWNEAIKNGNIDINLLMETSLRSGFFFHQNQEQITILQNTDPLNSLPNFKGNVLFINGSLDHRDSEEKWLSCIGKERGKLIDYEKADHFFSHDDRFYKTFINDMSEFIQKCHKKK